jgi:hypothetical protein
MPNPGGRPNHHLQADRQGELTAIKIGNKTRSSRGTRITAKSVEAFLASAPKVEITGKSYLTLKTRRRLAREQAARDA